MLVAAVLIAAAVSAASSTAASPAATAGGAGGAPAPPDGSYSYSIQQGGTDVGKSSLKIQRSEIGISLHETQTLSLSYTFNIDAIFDPASLAPRAFTGTYARGADSSTVRVAVDRNGATVTIDGVPGTAPFPNQRGIKNVYLLEGTTMSGFFMLPAQLHASRASEFSQVLPRTMLQFLGRVNPRPSAARPAGVPPGDAVLSISGQANVDEWYDPATFVVHAVSVPSQQLLLTLKK